MDWKTMSNIDPMDMEIIRKKKEKLTLRDPLSLEELFSIMEAAKDQFPGAFQLQKGLFGSAITFDKYMNFGVKIKVKDALVTLLRMDPSSNSGNPRSQSMEQLGKVVNAAQEIMSSMSTGVVSDELMGGPKYFAMICDTMGELLQSRM